MQISNLYHLPTELRGVLGASVMAYLLAWLLNLWLYSVIYRAYLFMKRQVANDGQPQMPIV